MACRPPPARVWSGPFGPPLRDFVARLNAGAAGAGARCNSWWRDQLSNQAVEGAAFSQHLVGLGADLGAANLAALASRLRARGLTVVVYPTHVHAQYWPAGRLEAYARAQPALRSYLG